MNRFWSRLDMEMLAAMVSAGHTQADIARRLDRSKVAVCHKVKELRSKGKLPEFRPPPMTEEKLCLHCRKPFLPRHRDNWICQPCKSTGLFESGMDYTRSQFGSRIS